jgi:hypothetical protein
MKDYIKELCINKKIKPVYTENKFTILSNGAQNGIPVLRIHKMFKNCSRKTAQAVVNYYLDTENRENYVKQIQTHSKKFLGVSKYYIAPLNDKFTDSFICNHMLGEENIDPESVLMEQSITSMAQKDSDGNHSTKLKDGIIKVQDGSIMELDIVVDK